jgi:hypothetical protein
MIEVSHNVRHSRRTPILPCLEDSVMNIRASIFAFLCGLFIMANVAGHAQERYAQFSNDVEYLSAPSTDSLNLDTPGFTIQFWVRRDANLGYDAGCVVSKRDPASIHDYRLGLGVFINQTEYHSYGSSKPILTRGDGTSSENYFPENAGDIAPENVWVHFSVTYDSLTDIATWFLNGEAVTTQKDSTGRVGTVSNNEPLMVGLRRGPGGTYINRLRGSLDELRIWRRKLSASEIRSNWWKDGLSVGPGLIAYYDFDGTAIDTIEDKSGHSITLNVLGAVDFPGTGGWDALGLIQPQGGESWNVGSAQHIDWFSANIQHLMIEMSTDGGSTWVDTIASMVPASAGSYAWIVPNRVSSECKIRVSDTDDPTTNDVSSAVFSISPSSITWLDTLLVSDCDAHASLIFGQADSATSCIDTRYGEYMLPPIGPSGIFDARFMLPCDGLPGSFRDFRNDSLTLLSWEIHIQRGACGGPVALTWNPHILPGGAFHMMDQVYGSRVDMKQESTYTLTNLATSTLWIFRRPYLWLDVPVRAGWNIVSVPLEASSMLTDSLFPGHLTPAYTFDRNSGYMRCDTLAPGHGYWLKFRADTTYTICGLPVLDRTIQLATGWNLIGPFECHVDTTGLIVPSEARRSFFFGYEIGYYIAESLLPGRGYWINVDRSLAINLPECPLAPSPEAVMPEAHAEASVIGLRVLDRLGKCHRLYFAASDISSELPMLTPPAPPEQTGSVSFTGGSVVERLGVARHVIIIDGLSFPLSLSLENANGLEFNLEEGVRRPVLSERESILILSPRAEIRLFEKTAGGEAPEQFALAQNYPNPFNPTTLIEYTVPGEMGTLHATSLHVFDILGRSVATLVDETETPGMKSVQFDATDLAAGVYFYRLKVRALDRSAGSAGEYVRTRKMLLVK